MRQAFLLFALLLAFGASANPQSFETTHWKHGYTTIDSRWRFHPGDDPAWASATFDDSAWRLLETDTRWSLQGYQGEAGYSWFRLRLKLPVTTEPLAIDVGRIASAAEVYINGNLAGTVGIMRPKPDWSLQPDVNVIPIPVTLNGRWVEVAVRDWKSPVASNYSGGGILSHPRLGTLAALRDARSLAIDRFLIQSTPNLVLDLVYLGLGIFSFGLFVVRRRSSEYAWFALSALGFAHGDMARILVAYPQEKSVTTWTGDMGFLWAVLSVALLIFIWRFINTRFDTLLYTAAALTLFDGLITCASYYTLVSLTVGQAVSTICGAIITVLLLVRLVRSTWQGNREAQLLLLPVTLVGLIGVVDGARLVLFFAGLSPQSTSFSNAIVYQNSAIAVPYRDLFQLLFLISIAAALITRFMRSAERDERLSSEVAAAKEVQTFLVPRVAPKLDHFELEAAYLPASEVGGDFYHVLQLENESVRLVVGDISGKGVSAAMAVAAVIGALGADSSEQPAEVLAKLNQVLYRSAHGRMATCCCAVVRPSGWMVLANAGHLPPYRNGQEVEVPAGLPLGLVAEWEQEDCLLRMEPDDTFTFVSDGVVEAQNANGKLFGFERTQAASEGTAQAIAQAAQRFGQCDDITVLKLRRSLRLQETSTVVLTGRRSHAIPSGAGATSVQ